MGQELVEKLRGGAPVLPEVRECHSTSLEDKRRILAEVDKTEGGQAAFNQFLFCAIELQFG
eukprot:12733425-Heterocapsa_arctica.AAC.1